MERLFVCFGQQQRPDSRPQALTRTTREKKKYICIYTTPLRIEPDRTGNSWDRLFQIGYVRTYLRTYGKCLKPRVGNNFGACLYIFRTCTHAFFGTEATWNQYGVNKYVSENWFISISVEKGRKPVVSGTRMPDDPLRKPLRNQFETISKTSSKNSSKPIRNHLETTSTQFRNKIETTWKPIRNQFETISKTTSKNNSKPIRNHFETTSKQFSKPLHDSIPIFERHLALARARSLIRCPRRLLTSSSRGAACPIDSVTGLRDGRNVHSRCSFAL